MSQDTEQPSYRERRLEHLRVSELLKLSWQSYACALEISQVDISHIHRHMPRPPAPSACLGTG